MNIENKDLAVADLAGFSSRLDGIACALNLLAVDCNLDFHFWQKIHSVFGATVDFRLAFLTSIPLNFGCGQPSMPIAISASCTADSRPGWMIATIYFILVPSSYPQST